MKGRTAKVLVKLPALRCRRLFVPVRLVLRSNRLLIFDHGLSKLLGKVKDIFILDNFFVVLDVCHLACCLRRRISL